MDLVWEWQRANGLRPRCRLGFDEYQALVEECRAGALTWDRPKDDLDELLDRLEHRVCP